MLDSDMTIEERRERERAARRQLIVTTSRRIAEAEGMGCGHHTSVVRRNRVQPAGPLQALFRTWKRSPRASLSRDSENWPRSLSNARRGAVEPEHALRRIAHAYIDFAIANPAVYDAMFTRATTLHFAASDTPPELSAAFAELRAVVAAVADTADADTATETLWAALHGLATLGRSGRLRGGHDSERVNLLAAQFVAAT